LPLEVGTKFGTKSVITRFIGDIPEIFVHNRGFSGTGYRMLPTLVAMATKFETKDAITQLVYEISPRSLRLVGGFRGRPILNDVRQSVPRPTHVAMATKFKTKSPITRLV